MSLYDKQGIQHDQDPDSNNVSFRDDRLTFAYNKMTGRVCKVYVWQLSDTNMPLQSISESAYNEGIRQEEEAIKTAKEKRYAKKMVVTVDMNELPEKLKPKAKAEAKS